MVAQLGSDYLTLVMKSNSMKFPTIYSPEHRGATQRGCILVFTTQGPDLPRLPVRNTTLNLWPGMVT